MVQRVYRMIKEVSKDARIVVATSEIQVSAIKRQLRENVAVSVEPCRKDELMIIRQELNKLQNQLFIKMNILKQLESSIKNNIYFREEDILTLYNYFKKTFDQSIVKSIDEVIAFHKDLAEKRATRQYKQIEDINISINQLSSEITAKEKRVDEIYRELSETIDLAELQSLMQEITNIKNKLSKIVAYQDAIQKQENKKLETKKNIANQNVVAQNYLDSIKDSISTISNAFSNYFSIMYNDLIGAYVEVKNNVGDNTIRFNLDVKAPNNKSDGIKRVRVFSFNLVLLEFGKKYFDFIINDNKVLYGADFKALANIMKYLFSLDSDYQFIFAINESEYSELKKEINDDKLFSKIVDSNIKVKLLGNENDKLLGMTVEL